MERYYIYKYLQDTQSAENLVKMKGKLTFGSIFLTNLVLCCTFNENLTYSATYTFERFTSFSQDFPEIFNRVKSIVIGSDGDYYDSSDFLSDLVPVVKLNHSVLLYYFSWILDEEDLCFTGWRQEFLQKISSHASRTKRSANKVSKSLSYFHDNLFRRSITGYIFVVSLNMLPNVVDCIIEPLGIYLIIIDESSSEEVLEIVWENLLVAWEVQRSCEVYIMLHDQTLSLHPFLRNPLRNNSFGVMMNFRERPKDMLRNLNGYPLRIEMFHSAFNYERWDKQKGVMYYEGTDAEVMRSLRAFMNFTAIFQKADGDHFGYKLPNGSFTGTLGRISNRKCDLAIVGFFLKDYSNPDMEFTMPVYLDELCCVVRKAKQIPKYWIPLLCFEEYIWLLLLLTIVLSSSFWGLIRWFENRMFPDKEVMIQRQNQSKRIRESAGTAVKNLQLFIDTTLLMISSPMQRLTRVTSERVFLASVLLMSVVVIAIFQSNLSTAFIRPMYYSDITSLKALDEANMKITIKYKAMLDDLFPPEASEVSQHLRHRIWVINKTTIPMIEQVMETTNLATVTRKSTVQLENAKYFRTGEVFLIPECPKMYNLAYVLPKNSVFFKSINFVVLHLTRGGFLEKWIEEMNWNTTWYNRKNLGYTEEEKFRVFDLVDLQLPFYVLLIGSLISFGVLLVELYMFRNAK